MPLFFLLAGLFAGPVVSGPAGKLWRERVGKFSYLFVLWTLIHFAFFIVGAYLMGQSVATELQIRISRLVVGVSPMWFLLALAVFFAIARLLRRVRPVVQLSMAGVVACLLIIFGEHSLVNKLWLLAFFLIGCVHGQRIQRTAAPADRVAESKMLAPLRWIGARTMPIYLMHVPAMSILWVCPPLTAVFHTVYPVAPGVFVALVVAASLLVYQATYRATALYELPNFRSPRPEMPTT